MFGLVGKDTSGNAVWVHTDGLRTCMRGHPLQGLKPANGPGVDAGGVRLEAEQGLAVGPVGTDRSDTNTSGKDTGELVWDEDEELLAGLEDDVEQEAAAPSIAAPYGLVGKDSDGNSIWVRSDGPHCSTPSLGPAPEPRTPPPEPMPHTAQSDHSGYNACDRIQAAVKKSIRDPSRELPSSVWVGKLGVGVTVQDLRDAFAGFGQILGVCLQPRKPVDTSLGCGVVNFASAAAAAKALQRMQSAFLGGYNILVRPVDTAWRLPPATAAHGDHRIPAAPPGWACQHCSNVNWPFRKACFRCQAPRSGDGLGQLMSGESRGKAVFQHLSSSHQSFGQRSAPRDYHGRLDKRPRISMVGDGGLLLAGGGRESTEERGEG
jgi:hypothetical protein